MQPRIYSARIGILSKGALVAFQAKKKKKKKVLVCMCLASLITDRINHYRPNN